MKYTFLIVLCLLHVSIVDAQSDIDKALSFGVVPQQSSKQLLDKWGPVIGYLSAKTGLKLQLKSAKSIPEFEKQVSIGGYDFAYMNPYHYVVFSESPGYRAIAREINKRIKGIIVTRKDGNIQSINDLANLKIAFPAPNAFAASILPRAYLNREGIKVTPMYVNSHSSVYQSIFMKHFPAGGGIMRTFELNKSSVKAELKILWESKGYSPHAIAVHPRVAAQHSKALVLALGEMHKDSKKGQSLLKKIAFKGFEQAKDSDWDDIRGLQIDTSLDLTTKKFRKSS